MQFHIQEGTFELPAGLQDNSMNMLMTGTSGLDLSLIVTRDRLDAGESYGAFMERQIKSVTLQVKDFEVTERHEQKSAAQDELIGLEVSQKFKQNGQWVYQRQRSWLLPDKVRVLVLTAASVAPITDTQMQRWKTICASFQPRD
ncbi:MULTISPECIES: DcrB-related protein [unclassified Acidovorax]|uniref:DcrB-related protein n=1 Tax=unclassified Acidovorax TaxID=2684926 RepID=UPI0024E08C6B|nr:MULTISPECIES: DcrB-related protein [unclassified Acidovorax]